MVTYYTYIMLNNEVLAKYYKNIQGLIFNFLTGKMLNAKYLSISLKHFMYTKTFHDTQTK